MVIIMPRALARRASGLYTGVRVPDEVASKLVEVSDNGKRFCKLCGAGPFSKNGMFMHLTRKHYGDLVDLIESYRASREPAVKRKQSPTAMRGFGMRLPVDLLEKLEDFALRKGVSKSEVVREALAEYLNRQGVA